MTTSIILIQAILEKIGDEGILNYTSASDIRKKFIFESKDGGISRSYIFGYDKDNPSYEFLKTKIFKEMSFTSKYEETIYTNNLEMAKEFFKKNIDNMNVEEIELIYKKITQHLLFNIFTISEEVDVCVAFETMNNRGKPLSYLELLKNRLIYLSIKLDEIDYEKEKLRTAINECWKSIYHSLGRNKNRPLDDDIFLGTHYILYFSSPPENDGLDVVYDDRSYSRGILKSRDHYKKLLNDIFVVRRLQEDGATKEFGLNEIYDYVSSLRVAVESWYKMFNSAEVGENLLHGVWLEKLDRLNRREFFPLILSVLLRSVSDSDKIAIFRALERYIFVFGLVNHSQYYFVMENFLTEAIHLYHEKINAKQVATKINDTTNSFISNTNFSSIITDAFRSRGFYSWSYIRYFLYEYNLDLQSRSKTERKKIHWSEYADRYSDYRTVEHIYPQNARATYWKSRFSGFSAKQREFLKNSLGNLVPLSQPKNASLSNKPFHQKLDGSVDEIIGYRYGCYAENELSKFADWEPKNIRDRGLGLLAFMEKRWSLQFGPPEQKLKMLSVEFLSS